MAREVERAPRKQKIGLEASATRALLLDAAEQLMCEEGYAAVTSRRLGKRAGVGPQLVHYYFRTMDDLFVTLYRRRSERFLQLAQAALDTDQPLRVLWRQSIEPGDVALNLEFMALANHRKALRAEMTQKGEQLRRMQHAALLRHFERRGIDPPLAPSVITVLLASVGFLSVVEAEAGMTFGHDETAACVESFLRRFDTPG